MKRLAATILLAALLFTAGAPRAQEDPANEKNWLNEKTWPALVLPRQMKIEEKDGEEVRLEKERFNAVQDELRNRYVYWLQDVESLPQVYEALGRAIDARQKADPTVQPLDVLKEKVEFARVAERQAKSLEAKFRRARQIADVPCAAYFRATAELELRRAQSDAARNAK